MMRQTMAVSGQKTIFPGHHTSKQFNTMPAYKNPSFVELEPVHDAIEKNPHDELVESNLNVENISTISSLSSLSHLSVSNFSSVSSRSSRSSPSSDHTYSSPESCATEDRASSVQWNDSVKKRRGCAWTIACKVTGGVLGALLVAFLIAYFEFRLRMTEGQNKVLQAATVEMRLNDTFQPEMADLNSPLAQAYSHKFCSNLAEMTHESLPTAYCRVTNLTEGSVVVTAEVVFTSTNRTSQELEEVLKHNMGALVTGGEPNFGTLNVYPNSVQVISIGTVTDNDTAMHNDTGQIEDLQRSEFDCIESKSKPYYRPYQSTYPIYCNQYQLCVNGHSFYQECLDGLEFFAVEDNSDSSPCRLPSDQTYCGILRAQEMSSTTPLATVHKTNPGSKSTEESSTTPTTTTATATTTTVTVSTSAATDMKNANIYTAVTIPSAECQTISTNIYTNSSALYTCPETGDTFLPSVHTYPYNCSDYIWCVNGHPNSFRCAPGTIYTLGAYPCGWSWDLNNFCQQMSRAQSCRAQGYDARTTSPVPNTDVSKAALQFSCAGVRYGFIPTNSTKQQCGEYQLCAEGNSYPESCPQNMHFTMNGQVCTQPEAEDTYCNQINSASRHGQ